MVALLLRARSGRATARGGQTVVFAAGLVTLVVLVV